jgi:hypothetical protein
MNVKVKRGFERLFNYPIVAGGGRQLRGFLSWMRGKTVDRLLGKLGVV